MSTTKRSGIARRNTPTPTFAIYYSSLFIPRNIVIARATLKISLLQRAIILGETFVTLPLLTGKMKFHIY